MSWDGFKKTLNRASTSFLQLAGAMEKTIDIDFDDLEKSFQLLSNSMDDISKLTRACLEVLKALLILQSSIIDNIKDSIQNIGRHRQIVLIKEIYTMLNGQNRIDFEETFRATVIEPINYFHVLIPDIMSLIKKHHNRTLDYDSARNKFHGKKGVNTSTSHSVISSSSSSSNNSALSELEENMKIKREAFEQSRERLMEMIPKLLELSAGYLEDSYWAIEGCIGKFTHSLSYHLDNNSVKIKSNLFDTSDQILSRMKKLQITMR